MTTTTTITTSGPSLQILSEAAASSWLLQWSGLVGLVAARAGNAGTNVGTGTEPKTTLEPKNLKRPNLDSSHRRCFRPYGHVETGFPRVRGGREGGKTRRLWKGSVRLRYEGTNAKTTPRRPREDMRARGSVSPCSTTLVLDSCTVEVNVRQCAFYLSSRLPPLLLRQITDTAWRTLSEEVTLGGRDGCTADHQVKEWCQKAPVLIRVGMRVTNSKYVLDLTGLPENALPKTLRYLDSHLPVHLVSGVMLPKGKRKQGHVVDSTTVSPFLYRSCLTSLSMNLDLVDKCVLRDVSRLSLNELNLCGGRHSDREVMGDFCGIPLSTSDQVVEALNGDLRGLLVTRLAGTLRKLTISLPGVSSAIYNLFLVVFRRLQHYNPPSGAGSCVSAYARMKPDTPLNLVSLNLGRASRQDILQASKTCPALRDVSLSVDFDCEDTLDALRRCERLSGVQVSYYPASVSAAPKINANVLIPLVDFFGKQLLSLGLTGFSLKGNVLDVLAGLPDLRRLSLSDCWVSHPLSRHNSPFPSLDTLSLTFLPPLDTMRLLTAGSELQSLDIQVLESESPGNVLTDEHVRQLVMSGALTSIQSFNASSPCLTLVSLRHLAALPRLRSVGILSRWGVTKEELQCVGHSGPPHLICHS